MNINQSIYKSLQQNTLPVGNLGYNNNISMPMSMDSSSFNNNLMLNSAYNNSPTNIPGYNNINNMPMGNSHYNNPLGNLGYNNSMGNSNNPMNTTIYNSMPIGGLGYNSPNNQYSVDPNNLTPPQNGFNQQFGSNLLNLFKSSNQTPMGMNN